MMQNPNRVKDAQKPKGILGRLAEWLTRKTNVEASNHLYPPVYD